MKGITSLGDSGVFDMPESKIVGNCVTLTHLADPLLLGISFSLPESDRRMRFPGHVPYRGLASNCHCDRPSNVRISAQIPEITYSEACNVVNIGAISIITSALCFILPCT